MENASMIAFLATYGTATLRFDATREQANEIAADLTQMTTNFTEGDDPRSAMREIIRTGFLDDDHLDPAKSQTMANIITYLCMTSSVHDANPGNEGYIIEITDKKDGSANFRFMGANNRDTVDEFTAKARENRKYVVTVTPEQAARAVQQKKTPIPRDPSLEPPPKPRPDHWLTALDATEKTFGSRDFVVARECLEKGAMFVWRSRQIAEQSEEEINATLSALAEFDRLHLPMNRIWAETRDFIDVPVDDAPAKRVEAKFAIAAAENGGVLSFWGFVEVNAGPAMSCLTGTISKIALEDGRRHFELVRPDHMPIGVKWDESAHRRISRACGDRLLELLFLLSTSGVARDRVRAESGKPGKLGKRKQHQRALSARDYTVIRVPLHYIPNDGQTGTSGQPGRWVRPHVRRAHMWGKNTRPVEEQHWRDACLVGATKVGEDVEIRRPEYRVG